MQDDIERFGDVGSLEDNVESFLSHDVENRRDLYGTLKQSPAGHHKECSKGNLILYTLYLLGNWKKFLHSI